MGLVLGFGRFVLTRLVVLFAFHLWSLRFQVLQSLDQVLCRGQASLLVETVKQPCRVDQLDRFGLFSRVLLGQPFKLGSDLSDFFLARGIFPHGSAEDVGKFGLVGISFGAAQH